jgi:two-component system OmpR family sensor kinase
MKPPEKSGGASGALAVILAPRRWPIRWRLAGVSAGLTLAILIVFAVVVGRLATDRLEGDFHDELESGAVTVAHEVQVEARATLTGARFVVDTPNLDSMTMASGDEVRLVDSLGNPFPDTTGQRAQTADAPSLGAPTQGISTFGRYDIATAAVVTDPGQSPPVYVQYARKQSQLDSTVDRLWLLLIFGVLGGTALAALAGFAVAGRAMRPIAALTATAREIASTRDPSQRIPESEREDEVAELGRTLDQMLRQLDAARSETEQMVQAQREFIADASHELRTPLTSILANLELLDEQLSERERAGEQGEIVASALSSSQRMRRLVADLLLLARADAGRTGTRRECDLSEIAEAALAEVRPVADGHILQLAGGEPVSVDGNPDELHRLVVNLLDNGLRHTPDGTTIAVNISSRNGAAVLEVTDDGPGVPEEQREHVFSRFARIGGPADTAPDSGTGLGLAIVQAVARSHGGDVEVGDAPAGGARFTVTLPAMAQGADETAENS